mgnify:CR=1 FL=1
MRYISTRNDSAPATFSTALMRGIAPDGGLYVPATWPRFESRAKPSALPAFAADLLQPFVADDALADDLGAITAEAFSLPAPLVEIPGYSAEVLELFHGPTAAFKDFGARFLAGAMARIRAGAWWRLPTAMNFMRAPPLR